MSPGPLSWVRNLTGDISDKGFIFISSNHTVGPFKLPSDISVTFLMGNPTFPEHWGHMADWVLSWVSVSQGHIDRMEAPSLMLTDLSPWFSRCQPWMNCYSLRYRDAYQLCCSVHFLEVENKGRKVERESGQHWKWKEQNKVLDTDPTTQSPLDSGKWSFLGRHSDKKKERQKNLGAVLELKLFSRGRTAQLEERWKH